jgi:hypothetical protein
MKIETPGNPQTIDEYTAFRFTVPDPQPVQLNGNTRTLDRLPFDEIDFSVVPQIVRNALDKTQIEGGKVTKLTFMTYIGKKFGWDVDIQGTRETASVRADIAGNIVSVDLSQTNRAAEYKIFSEAELTNATNAIKAKFGENAQLQKITIRESSLETEIISAENLNKIDVYIFGISGLKKSQLPAMPVNPINEVFQFSAIKLTDAVNLAQKAKEKLAMPDGQITSITLEQRRAFTKINEIAHIIWTVSVKQGANSGSVSYDNQSNEVSFNKD